MKKNILNLLDCTLRDGGYYNNWDFSPILINKYLSAVSKAGVDVVEIGFRSFNNKENLGACAYSKDSFIDTINLPKNIKISVMINAAEIIQNKGALNKIFKIKKKSKVEIIRIAAHFREINKIEKEIKYLRKLKYKVFLNIMQISERNSAEIEFVGKFSKLNKIDVLYFADSMGSLESSEIINIIRLLKKTWNGPLGIHTHDNLSRATLNTKIAVENGVKWIDSTVDGMGRGPGNAKTEYLIFEYQKQLKKKINPIPILNLVSKEFMDLKSKYKWGTNPFYYLSGLKKIHPTFVQTMLSDNKFTNSDILSTINYISSIDGTKFNRKLIYKDETKNLGSWRPSSILKDKNVIILGNGPSVIEQKKLIEKVISQSKLFVISLNTQKHIKENLIKLRVISNELRFLTERKKLNTLKQRLVIPYNILSEKIKKNITKNRIYNFGFSIKNGLFKFSDKYAVGPNSLAISYALAIANSGRSNKIFLAGIDGYDENDPRHIELQKTFEILNKNKSSIPYFALTNTKLNIPTVSLHTLLK